MATFTTSAPVAVTLSTLFAGRMTANQRKIKPLLGDDDNAINSFESEVFARMSAKFEAQLNCITPAQLFRACAEVIEAKVCEQITLDTTAKDSFFPFLQFAKMVIKSLVIDGFMAYTPASKVNPMGYYALNAKAAGNAVIALIREAGKGQAVGFRKNTGTRHEQGAAAMAKRAFTINIERAKEAREHLAKGEFLNKSEQWQPAETKKEMLKREQQVNQFKSLIAVYKETQGGAFSFDVMPDFRGRLYYVAGNLNPQAGGLAFYCLHNANQITLDATASFAQFMAMITGNKSLGESCGLMNYTDTPSDFYALTYAAATGLEAPKKNTITRLLAKIYLMPKAYGCSDSTSVTRAKKEAEERGLDTAQAEQVVQALSDYTEINIIKDAASAKVAELAALDNIQLQWVTPFGFNVKQNYFVSEIKQWDTGKDTEYMPSAISFAFKTEKVAVSDTQEHGADKTADIAAAANIIQSYDAAFLAEVANRYYEQTGCTFTAIHDSATLDHPEHHDLYLGICWSVFCDMADSNRVKELRTLLGLGKVDASWINRDKVPTFICLE